MTPEGIPCLITGFTARSAALAITSCDHTATRSRLTSKSLFDGDRLSYGHRRALAVHKASFVLWFAAMTIHVLGHVGEVFRLAPRDWLRRSRREVSGAGTRQWLIAASLVAGVMLGFLLLSQVGHWLSAAPGAGQ
jgi:hypothetical protein